MSIIEQGLISLLVIVFAGPDWFAFDRQGLALGGFGINVRRVGHSSVSLQKGTGVSSTPMMTLLLVPVTMFGNSSSAQIAEERGIEWAADALARRRRASEEALSPPSAAC